MNICIEGCAHGDLEVIYSKIHEHEERNQKKIDVLICCGDFQATRNKEDLACMAVPLKYLEMGSFYKFYSGELQAPILTIFIGGNHEASNHLQELAYGGWVAPNIYYLGYAGVININGIRIGGISGIYRDYNFNKGHFEFPPYDDSTVRSAYAIRNLEVFRLMQLSPSKIDIMLSHDWPQNIWRHGDKSTKFGSVESLLKFKPAFRADMDSGKLGSPPCYDLILKLKPKYWFAAHMHCRFDAKIEHDEQHYTKFVALDKCLPRRNYLEFITIGDEIERNEDGTAKLLKICYDAEWLAILSSTNNLLNCSYQYTKLPQEPQSPSQNSIRWNFNPSQLEIETILKKLQNNLDIPQNFRQTVDAFNPEWESHDFSRLKKPKPMINIQTTEFCDKLAIDDPLFVVTSMNKVEVIVTNYSTSDADAFKDRSDFVGDNEEEEKVVTSNKKIPLSLPKPINNDDEINLDDLEDDDNEEETKEPQLQTKDTKQEINIVNLSTVDEIDNTNEKITRPLESVEESNMNQSAAKKFKRRNVDIYAAVEDD